MIILYKKEKKKIMKVKYENIVLKTDYEIKKICGFLNINYSEDMLHYKRRAENKSKFGDPTGIYSNYSKYYL